MVDAAYAACSDWTTDGPRLDAESGLAVACEAGGDSFTKDSCEAVMSEDNITPCVFTATAPSLVASGCAALIAGEEACTAAWPSRRDMAACGATCGLTPAALQSSEFMNAERCMAPPETCLDIGGLSCAYTAGDEASCTSPCVYTAAPPAVDPVAAAPPACRDVASSADAVVDCAAAPDGFDQAACEAAASDAGGACVYEPAVAPCSEGDYVPPMLCDFSYANVATTAQEGYAVDVPFKIDMDTTDNADGTYLVWGVGMRHYWRS